MSAGIRNPRRDFAIALVMAIGGSAAVIVGIVMMSLAGGAETGLSGGLIGVGLLVGIIGILMSVNFFWAVRLADAMRRGEGVIARWTVPAETLEEFRADEETHRRNGRPNDYRLPKWIPPEGLEVIFSHNAVMIGDFFHGLAKGGIARFRGVQMVPGNPLALSFATAMTVGRHGSAGMRLSTVAGELRVPIARTANDGARAVLAHYTSVTAGQTVARPGFWAFRIRLGLWTATIFGAIAALGFLFNALKLDLGDAPLIMAVTGVMVGLGGLVLAGLAWKIGEHERRDLRR